MNGDNLNLNTTPTNAPYMDELGLSPVPQNQNVNKNNPTPKLMISETPMPEPSLEIYKGENGVVFNTSPTPEVPGSQTWSLGNIFLWFVMLVSIVMFISGIVYVLKNSTTEK